MLRVRKLIYDVAAREKDIGSIEETLKWGEPSYAPRNSNIGTAVRIGWHPSRPEQFGVYVHCQTNLIENFKKKYPKKFLYQKTRGIIFFSHDSLHMNELREFIRRAFLYYR
jgi:hypothetical protein